MLHVPAAFEAGVPFVGAQTHVFDGMMEDLDECATQRRRQPERDQRWFQPTVVRDPVVLEGELGRWVVDDNPAAVPKRLAFVVDFQEPLPPTRGSYSSRRWPRPNHSRRRSNVSNSCHTRSGVALMRMLRRTASVPIVVVVMAPSLCNRLVTCSGIVAHSQPVPRPCSSNLRNFQRRFLHS